MGWIEQVLWPRVHAVLTGHVLAADEHANLVQDVVVAMGLNPEEAAQLAVVPEAPVVEAEPSPVALPIEAVKAALDELPADAEWTEVAEHAATVDVPVAEEPEAAPA